MASLVNIKLENEKCIDCNIFFGYNTDNRCSLCHIFNNEYHPDHKKYYKDKDGIIKLIFNKKYSSIFLDNFTKSRKLPNNNKLFNLLKEMFKTGSFMKDNNFIMWLDCLKKINYKGIDITQAIELSSIVNNSEYQNINEKWRIGHYICGLIIDWWNIRGKNISVVQCYYNLQKNDDKDTKPIYNTKIKNAALFDNKCNYKKKIIIENQILNIPCPNHGKDIKYCKLEHNNRYHFCIKNFFNKEK